DTEYSDNAKRFAFLYRAAIDACTRLEWIPDILHVHDWHAAPALAYRRSGIIDPRIKKTGGILTIHNLEYRGFFPLHETSCTGLDFNDLLGTSKSRRAFSFLLSGLRSADRITTVSPTYLAEIMQDENSEFGDAVRDSTPPALGILNGIDYHIWNPASDPHLPYNFSALDMAGKRGCKEAIQKQLGLDVRPDLPLIGIVTRLVKQKGIEELLKSPYRALEKICARIPVQIAVLGTGERWAEEELQALSAKYHNLNALITFNEETAHRIEAASDFFLMPSRFEPCGLNQMYSMAYGTLPIVTPTGGLADTVQPYNADSGDGTGFFIKHSSPTGIYHAVKQAALVWETRKEHIQNMIGSAMAKRFSWDKAAESYEAVYSRAVKGIRVS
ncbi:MAG: glycogen synthase, partial [Spirochaetales bacterium]|nr:glycogen synthase [Spirochaetales bacterium]